MTTVRDGEGLASGGSRLVMRMLEGVMDTVRRGEKYKEDERRRGKEREAQNEFGSEAAHSVSLSR